MTLQKMSLTSNGLPAAQVSEDQVEAARYAVLRRVAPCLRHDLVRPLQPIGLIYGVMHHKLSADEPDLKAVRAEAEKINAFAKAALEECMVVGTWLAPEQGIVARADAGIRECIGLLASMLHFCGFHVVNEVEDLPVQVQRDAVRMVLSAALLQFADSMTQPATLTVRAVVSGTEVILTLEVTEKSEGNVDCYDDGYRKLSWRDVEALAAAENVALSREGERVMMRFEIDASASQPLVN
ncbi:MAG: hypothetical protein JWR68_943 [Polaromonas sp.]|nr:hypothetical protein [Polaromonas sp.]